MTCSVGQNGSVETTTLLYESIKAL